MKAPTGIATVVSVFFCLDDSASGADQREAQYTAPPLLWASLVSFKWVTYHPDFGANGYKVRMNIFLFILRLNFVLVSFVESWI